MSDAPASKKRGHDEVEPEEESPEPPKKDPRKVCNKGMVVDAKLVMADAYGDSDMDLLHLKVTVTDDKVAEILKGLDVFGVTSSHTCNLDDKMALAAYNLVFEETDDEKIQENPLVQLFHNREKVGLTDQVDADCTFFWKVFINY